MGFRTLRVINEDRVQPEQGFGTHPHDNMEIVTYVVAGSLTHEDSMGNGAEIRPGEIQRMSAGTGITHSEFNRSPDEPVHLLQIWILPERQGLTPSYEQKRFTDRCRANELCLIVSPDGRDDSVRIHQDVAIYTCRWDEEAEVRHALAADRHAWIQVIKGHVAIGGETLASGDGCAVSDEAEVTLRSREGSELLLFDLA
jgi:redox-sensitive bicupin YhaK (pirin superfamily)